jgi:hypothetical protein
VLAAALLSLVLVGRAQDRPVPTASTTDPRVSLKPGFRDAGVAAKHMTLVAAVPKPDGFFNPNAPAGTPAPPERQGNATPPAPPPGTPPAAPADPNAPPPAPPPGGGGLDFANSDIAFSGTHLFLGNFHGFQAYDIERSNRPQLLASVVCPGGQGDMSIYGNLLFMSVEQTRGRIDCGIGGVALPSSPERFRGVRIFDVSDLKNPRQVAAVQTCRGSHTHTLVGPSADKQFLYVYGSGTGQVRPGDELAGCSAGDPKDNPETALFSIDVIEVPLAAPGNARVVNRPRIFMDTVSGNIAGLWAGGDHGPGSQRTSATNQCHDITVYPEIGLAAGACSGNGILLDISDPRNPKRLDFVSDRNFAYWHSATFNNDGTKVIFTDEWGGGTRPRCRAADPLTWGADAIFDIVETLQGKKLEFRSYFKMPAAQTEQENCVAHNGSLIPVPGRDIMAQGWYQGGVSIFDFTDSAHPVEIAYFDRGPIDAKNLITGGYWSAYWFNGYIYGSEIARGLDIFRLETSEFLSQNEIDAAIQVRYNEFNVQRQPRVGWPPTVVVARAYVDQLVRAKSLPPARVTAIRRVLDRAERPGRETADVAGQLESEAARLEQDAAAATDLDARRMKALAETMRGRAAAIR